MDRTDLYAKVSYSPRILESGLPLYTTFGPLLIRVTDSRILRELETIMAVAVSIQYVLSLFSLAPSDGIRILPNPFPSAHALFALDVSKLATFNMPTLMHVVQWGCSAHGLENLSIDVCCIQETLI